MAEIEELLEEIETLKDEIRDLRRKRKESSVVPDNEHLALKDELEAAAKDAASSKRRCELLTKDSALKDEALSFVNNILTAQIVDDSSDPGDSIRVKSIEDYYATEIIPALKDIEPQYFNVSKDEIDSRGMQLRTWTNLQRKSWLANKKVVAFLGEFSAGKTSIVNRLVGFRKDEVLPENSKPTTAIPTYITYGREFVSRFLSPDDDLKVIGKEVFRKMKKDVLEQINVSNLIKYFVLNYNKDSLKDISILDTPGFNSNDKRDAERTCEVIFESDLLFWVVDVQMGDLNVSSLKVIRENLQGVPLHIVLNKCDSKTIAEQEAVEKKIVSTLKKYKVPYESIIRFSKVTDVSVLMNVIKRTEGKKRGEDTLAALYMDLKETVDEIKRNRTEKLKERDELLNNIDSVESEMAELHMDLSNLCCSLLDDFTYNSGGAFRGRARYELSPDEYEALKINTTAISVVDGKIQNSQELLDEYKDDIKKLEQGSDGEVGLEDVVDHYSQLKRNLDAWKRKISTWNSSYLKNYNCK